MELSWDDDESGQAPGLSPDQPLTIAQLTRLIKATLENNFPRIWISGEISDLARPRSGHIYLTLKDEQASIRAVMWRTAAARLPFELEDGQKVLCQGALEVYAPRGSYQIVLSKIQPQGIGGLQLAFQQLHAKLTAEGLFAAERKRPLPRFPRRIGFVTSPTAAALHDFIQVACRRWPGLDLVVIPTRVQGTGASQEIAAGIAAAQKIDPPLDVLVVGRGGGSLEDLWAFNEEPTVRAIASSKIPVVSAVGHEIDVTLADLAADVRALTPSEAAERVLPSREEWLATLDVMQDRVNWLIRSRIESLEKYLTSLSQRPVLSSPQNIIERKYQILDDWDQRARMAIWRRWQTAHDRCNRATSTLDALSPLRVLSRGYSVTRTQGENRVITGIDEIEIGDQIQSIVGDGIITSTVTAKKQNIV